MILLKVFKSPTYYRYAETVKYRRKVFLSNLNMISLKVFKSPTYLNFRNSWFYFLCTNNWNIFGLIVFRCYNLS